MGVSSMASVMAPYYAASKHSVPQHCTFSGGLDCVIVGSIAVLSFAFQLSNFVLFCLFHNFPPSCLG